MKKDKLDIIYEDKNIIVINKPAHMLCIATKNEKINTLYHRVHEYLYRQNKNNKVFIVHRLDKDTSGIVLFAKNEKMKKLLQESWNDIAIKREYTAIVEGVPEKKKDTIKQYLAETKTLKTYVTNNKNGAAAITSYEVIKTANKKSLLTINISTGRKNQIRVAMESIGHPIVGDKKYSAKTNPIRRMCLHAHILEIINPITKEVMHFESKIPAQFNSIIK